MAFKAHSDYLSSFSHQSFCSCQLYIPMNSFVLCWHLMSLCVQAACCSSIQVWLQCYLIYTAFVNPVLDFSQAELILLFPYMFSGFYWCYDSLLCNVYCWYLSLIPLVPCLISVSLITNRQVSSQTVALPLTPLQNLGQYIARSRNGMIIYWVTVAVTLLTW